MSQTINATGWECPKPIIATKQLLDTMTEGSGCTLVDNAIARDNLLDFAQSLGYPVDCVEKDGIWEITTTKLPGMDGATTSLNGDFVVLIGTDQFGGGAEELCRILMKSYIYALAEASPRPNILCFMNSGVFLTCQDSPVLDILETLAAEGVEILSCGACLEFYGLTEKLAVGSISNMYNIVSKLNGAAKALKI